jgi:hypothetical protein
VPREEAATSAPAIKVESEAEGRPRFKRKYHAALPEWRTITVTAYTGSYGDRYYSGELTQPGGRWVTFDPERVADKILDRELVPLVMALCREMLHMDDAYIASNPSEYDDEMGHRWRRVKT